jgi:hypothetical protein
VLNAAFPAATALSTSCSVASGTGGRGCLLAGLIPYLVLLVGELFPLMIWTKLSLKSMDLPLTVILMKCRIRYRN